MWCSVRSQTYHISRFVAQCCKQDLMRWIPAGAYNNVPAVYRSAPPIIGLTVLVGMCWIRRRMKSSAIDIETVVWAYLRAHRYADCSSVLSVLAADFSTQSSVFEVNYWQLNVATNGRRVQYRSLLTVIMASDEATSFAVSASRLPVDRRWTNPAVEQTVMFR